MPVRSSSSSSSIQALADSISRLERLHLHAHRPQLLRPGDRLAGPAWAALEAATRAQSAAGVALLQDQRGRYDRPSLLEAQEVRLPEAERALRALAEAAGRARSMLHRSLLEELLRRLREVQAELELQVGAAWAAEEAAERPAIQAQVLLAVEEALRDSWPEAVRAGGDATGLEVDRLAALAQAARIRAEEAATLRATVRLGAREAAFQALQAREGLLRGLGARRSGRGRVALPGLPVDLPRIATLLLEGPGALDLPGHAHLAEVGLLDVGRSLRVLLAELARRVHGQEAEEVLRSRAAREAEREVLAAQEALRGAQAAAEAALDSVTEARAEGLATGALELQAAELERAATVATRRVQLAQEAEARALARVSEAVHGHRAERDSWAAWPPATDREAATLHPATSEALQEAQEGPEEGLQEARAALAERLAAAALALARPEGAAAEPIQEALGRAWASHLATELDRAATLAEVEAVEAAWAEVLRGLDAGALQAGPEAARAPRAEATRAEAPRAA